MTWYATTSATTAKQESDTTTDGFEILLDQHPAVPV